MALSTAEAQEPSPLWQSVMSWASQFTQGKPVLSMDHFHPTFLSAFPNTKAPSFPVLWNLRLPWRNSSQLENCRFVFCPFHREACTFITTQTWYFKEAWEGESCITRRLTLSTQIPELSRAAVFGFPCAFSSELQPLYAVYCMQNTQVHLQSTASTSQSIFLYHRAFETTTWG